jgi:hypothetical protein
MGDIVHSLNLDHISAGLSYFFWICFYREKAGIQKLEQTPLISTLVKIIKALYRRFAKFSLFRLNCKTVQGENQSLNFLSAISGGQTDSWLWLLPKKEI